jgi:pSer/pThr/pTyr-binding forkhead associated (FHA) protein
MANLALRFISGKYKGGEFVLKEGMETVIGRSSDAEVVLMEDMVSRKHAHLVTKGEKIYLEDHGSTNGTFVNGEKVSKAVVTKGDRILIGTSIMKVVEASGEPAGVVTQDSQASKSKELSRTTMHSGSRSMSGTIAEVPLPDLIQLFSTSKKTGTLVLTRDGLVAKIHLDRGRLVYAAINDSPGLPPIKAIYRILAWDDGTFELVGPEPHNFPELIDMPTEHILMEGLRQLDELRHMQTKLPPPATRIGVPRPLEPRLGDLDRNELDVFQLAINKNTIQEILDSAGASDLDAANILVKLLKKRYLVTRK